MLAKGVRLYVDGIGFRHGQIGTPNFYLPGGGSVLGACSELRLQLYPWRMNPTADCQLAGAKHTSHP